MPVCFDTSLLVKLYAPEVNTPAVVALVASLNEPIWITGFHLAEFVNAIHRKKDRGEITETDVKQALWNFHLDQNSGVLKGRTPAWESILYRTVMLSSNQAANTHCRTLDILHVAIALELKASALATTDKRQSAIVHAVGLKVLAI